MIRKVLEVIPITTFIVVFFFLCGGLYLIGYWTTFNIDVSNLISLSDIPKSFILPCAITHGLFFSTLFVTPFMAHKKEALLSNEPNSKPKKSSGQTIVTILIFLYTPVFALFFSFFKYSFWFWIIEGLFLSYLLMFWSVYIKGIRLLFPHPIIRVYIIFTVIFTPVMSFFVGKAKSVDVYINYNIRYIEAIKKNNAIETQASKNNIRLKFVGFLGNKVIGSSLDNKRIFFFNEGELEAVVIDQGNPRKDFLRF